ncbi:MAG TPA: SDR family oxidoreductase [Deltaproteobacteria bacterium]|nr:SDR family oxidoreductase [Deltaproteobacteria bacterium]
MFDLRGRVALVTGAGRHVGLAIAEALARQGAAVAINDVVADRAHAAAEGLARTGAQALAVPADMTDLGAVEEAVAAVGSQLGPVDILVSNAGNAGAAPALPTPFLDMAPGDWHRYIDINFYAVLNGIHAVLPGMCRRNHGRIITISSDAGRAGVGMGMSVYSGGKAAAMGFQRSLACEVGPQQVTVNTIALGLVPGDWDAGSPDKIPLGRFGTPDDVGPAAVFFASDEAGWVTGQVLSVNGGYFRNL